MTDSTGLARFTTIADNVFADGEHYQLSTMTENASIGGYDAALTVGISL